MCPPPKSFRRMGGLYLIDFFSFVATLGLLLALVFGDECMYVSLIFALAMGNLQCSRSLTKIIDMLRNAVVIK